MLLVRHGLRPFVFVGLLVLAPPLSTLARPVLAAPQSTNFNLEGKITQHSAGKLTVSTEENIIFHVRYDEKTIIKRPDGSAGSAKDFHTGVKIKVEGDLTESGEIVAQKIEIQPASDSKQQR